jgi:hypothetical protein
MTNAASTPVRVAMHDDSGRQVSEELEYGAPANPTTSRRGIYDLPTVERGANLANPTIAGQPTIGSSIGAGRAGQVQPSESDSGTADSSREGVMTPEALGNTQDTKRS